jgi:hypothetical protein
MNFKEKTSIILRSLATSPLAGIFYFLLGLLGVVGLLALLFIVNYYLVEWGILSRLGTKDQWGAAMVWCSVEIVGVPIFIFVVVLLVISVLDTINKIRSDLQQRDIEMLGVHEEDLEGR